VCVIAIESEYLYVRLRSVQMPELDGFETTSQLRNMEGQWATSKQKLPTEGLPAQLLDQVQLLCLIINRCNCYGSITAIQFERELI